MGMSASQARLLGLQARQSNLEYQGQQINQERTILSQQCTALYNSLLAMTVPTPPSTQDYTTIQYAGTDGASKFTLGSIIPTGSTYTVEMKYKKTGHFLEEKGTAAVTNVPETIKLKKVDNVEPTVTKYYEQPASTIGDSAVANGTKVMCKVGSDEALQDGEKFYELIDGKFIELDNSSDASNKNNLYVSRSAKTETTTEGDKQTTTKNFNPETDFIISGEEKTRTTGGIKEADLCSYFAVDANDNAVRIDPSNAKDYFEELSDGSYKVKDGVKIYKQDESGAVYNNPDYENFAYYVEGQPCMTLTEANKAGRIGSTGTYNNYIQAIKDAYPEYANRPNSEIEADFKVYFTKNDSGLQVPHFVAHSDLTSGMTDTTGSKYVTTYDYSANGTYTSTVKEEDCMLTFDTSGRITEIKLPRYDENGKKVGYKAIPLEASTVTDEKAYQDAYNKYEYAQYEYDKAQQEINAKTEIIQQEDRNLELKLQRLDNERTQITTEIEAVEKVIQENIESSYKTFSG